MRSRGDGNRCRGPLWRHRLSGFTLVELLVVVAVITILAAILTPMAMRAMQSAKDAECKSNLGQILAAEIMYANHYEGFLTPTGSSGTPNPAKQVYRFPNWYINLADHMNTDREVFRCPAKRRTVVGYGINHIWCDGPDQIYGEGAAMNNTSKLLSSARNPAGTLLVCDSGKVTNVDQENEVYPPPEEWLENDSNGVSVFFPFDNVYGIEDGAYTYFFTAMKWPVPRHPGGHTNVGFLDRHVDGIPVRDIIDDLWREPGCIYDNW
ncbi:MAG: prepilin-type N-terminal cleavage/methylation domain-containing protein [Candidatus Brocadiae bacterium]|nr:prepilin-type N-terminal cleavage/methylation domain-containing protein [Candidatus Brocadiia bacterium]